MPSHSHVFLFEGNAAVIKMIIKGRSPNLRPVARPHRVNLDLLLERISLDPAVSVRYVTKSEQMAEALTKWSFTVVQ